MRRVLRQLRVKSGTVLGWLIHLPVTIPEALITWSVPAELRHGILLVDPDPITRPDFVRKIDAALNLIQRTDPVRHERVTREIKRIFHVPTRNGADYTRPLKGCSIEPGRFYEGMEEEFACDLVACVLIHEATHGHLYSRGIFFQAGANIQRVERLCCKAMNAFLRKRGHEGFTEAEEQEYFPSTLRDHMAWVKHIIPKVLKGDWNDHYLNPPVDPREKCPDLAEKSELPEAFMLKTYQAAADGSVDETIIADTFSYYKSKSDGQAQIIMTNAFVFQTPVLETSASRSTNKVEENF
jgi:hypothetical protein